MNAVTAEIDVTKPAGRRLVRDLENKKYVKMVYESPEVSGTWTSFEEVLERSFDILNEHYNVDMRELARKSSKYYK